MLRQIKSKRLSDGFRRTLFVPLRRFEQILVQNYAETHGNPFRLLFVFRFHVLLSFWDLRGVEDYVKQYIACRRESQAVF
jgi:hypothetical protein